MGRSKTHEVEVTTSQSLPGRKGTVTCLCGATFKDTPIGASVHGNICAKFNQEKIS